MGNKQYSFAQKFQQKYNFISFNEKSQFGPIKIYRKKQPNYDYLMIVQKYVMDEESIDQIQRELKSIRCSYKQQDQPKLLRLYGFQFIKDGLKNCNQRTRIKLYIEYFNYTLKDMIQNYFKKQQMFSLDQIMYVLYNTLKTYSFYQNFNTINFSVRSDNIFITTQGDIKFSPIQVQPEEQFHQIICTDNLNVNCNKIKIKKTFKFNDKLIIYQIKKLINQMTKIWNPNSSESREIFRFVKAINSCNSIQEMKKFIYLPQIQALNFHPKKQTSIASETTKNFKQSSTFSYNSDSKNSKISVKKTIKQRKQPRPFSHQP